MEGPNNIPDPPVAGALQAIYEYVEVFTVHIYSSRSRDTNGRHSMKQWLIKWMLKEGFSHEEVDGVLDSVHWPTDKPPAFVTIDDRALTFTGEWPSVDELKSFKPWYK